MTDWDKIAARGIVRKTVALHPVWDQYVRITQALILKENGLDASYSLALNYMLLSQVFSVINQGIDEKTAKFMVLFLEDQTVVEDMNYEDLSIKYEEALRDRTLKNNK